MKKRRGFSLVEITAATLISSFIAVSLATIYSASNRHIFQNFRSNTIKSDVSLGMHAIRNVMAQATRIEDDAPTLGSDGSRLELAVNVDQLTGCNPISSFEAEMPAWHLFCTSGGNLYHHTGVYPTVAGPACGCPNNCATVNPAHTTVCGTGGTLLTKFLDETIPVFSRVAGDIPSGNPMAVRVLLRARWSPPASLTASQRAVDHTLSSIFMVSRSGN